MHVLGGGALGALVAARAVAAGAKCTLLLRPSQLQSSLTLRISRDFDPDAAPTEHTIACEPSGADGPEVTTLVVATKAYSAVGAIKAIASRLTPDATVVLLCNGSLSVVDRLERAAATLLLGTTTHGAWLERAPRAWPLPNLHVHHAGNGQTWVGPAPALQPREESVQSALAAARRISPALGAEAEDRELTTRRAWQKLAANCVLNPLTALWNVQNGIVLSRDEGKATSQAVCAEVAALAAKLTPECAPVADALLEFTTNVATATAQNWSSMHQDLHHGRRTEIDALSGWVAERAAALGTPCDANAALAARVRAAEQSR